MNEKIDDVMDSADNEPFLSRSRGADQRNNEEESSLLDDENSCLDNGILLREITKHVQRAEDEDSEEGTVEQPQCRICLDIGGDDLIAPCCCRGTQKFVHRSCLDNWRAVKEGFAFSHCTECRTLFRLRANMPPDRWWLRMKFQLLVLRDHAAIFFVVQLVVASLGLLVYNFYGEELREMFGYEQHPYGFYILAAIIMILVGLLYGFFVAIICGQRISNRHYHILAKQELTKEYVVENMIDLEETSPSIGSAHINELRMLGLY